MASLTSLKSQNLTFWQPIFKACPNCFQESHSQVSLLAYILRDIVTTWYSQKIPQLDSVNVHLSNICTYKKECFILDLMRTNNMLHNTAETPLFHAPHDEANGIATLPSLHLKDTNPIVTHHLDNQVAWQATDSSTLRCSINTLWKYPNLTLPTHHTWFPRPPTSLSQHHGVLHGVFIRYS